MTSARLRSTGVTASLLLAAAAVAPLAPAQRCNTGRLVGGLLGGGLGYGLSRQDGRAWAVPLGALLGSQMGCSTAVGNGPRPW